MPCSFGMSVIIALHNFFFCVPLSNFWLFMIPLFPCSVINNFWLFTIHLCPCSVISILLTVYPYFSCVQYVLWILNSLYLLFSLCDSEISTVSLIIRSNFDVASILKLLRCLHILPMIFLRFLGRITTI